MIGVNSPQPVSKATLIQIDGCNHSGKGIVRLLLDGHPEIFVSPLHDILPQLFLKQDLIAPWLKQRDICQLRKLLASRTRYYRFEELNWVGNYPEVVGLNQTVFVPLSFDFYEVDRRIMSSLRHLNQWRPDDVMCTFYREIRAGLTGENCELPPCLVTMSEPIPSHMASFDDIYPGSKVIYLNRSVESVFAVHFATYFKGFPEIKTRNYFEYLLGSFPRKLIEYRVLASNLAKKYPDQFLIIEFSDLFSKRQSVIASICAFLEVSYKDSFERCSSQGTNVTDGGTQILDREIDIASQILSRQQLASLRREVALIEREMRSPFFYYIAPIRHNYKRIKRRILRANLFKKLVCQTRK